MLKSESSFIRKICQQAVDLFRFYELFQMRIHEFFDITITD